MWLPLVVAGCLVSVLASGCAEEGTTSEAVVEVVTQLAPATVRPTAVAKGNSPLGRSEVDSLIVTRVRILLSRLKLHPSSDTAAGGADIKTGPFVATFTAQSQQLALGSLPPGTYRWMKLEFHRFTDAEAARHANDTLLRDFATPERYNLLIEGTLYVRDSVIGFLYQTGVTANAALQLDPPAEANQQTLLQLLLQFDPAQAFVVAGTLLDPRRETNRSLIDRNLRNALRALKRTP